MPSTHDRAGSRVVSDLGAAIARMREDLDLSQWTEFRQSEAMPQLASHVTGSRAFARKPAGAAASALAAQTTSKIVGCVGEVLEMALLTRLGVDATLHPQGTDIVVSTDRVFKIEVKTSIGTRKNSKRKFTAFVAKKQLEDAAEVHMWYLSSDGPQPRWELIATPADEFAYAAAEFLPG